MCIWVWSAASNAVFQDWESWVFDRQVCGEQSTIAEYLAEKTGRIAREVRVRLGFTPAPVRFTCLHIRPHSGGPAFPDRGGLVGRLAIPRLHLSAMVREGADDKTLGLSLGHIPGTALPGQKGNVGVAGHRDTLFRCLREINKNDLILLETFAGNYVYRVESTEIVRPRDVNVLHAREYPELTLVTCYPFHYVGSAPERFIVTARQVPRSEMEPVFPVAQETARHDNHHDQVDGITPGRKAAEGQPSAGRVTFEVNKGHSRQLTHGISIGVTEIEMAPARLNGWLWVMQDRRTIWLRGQGAREPLVFYGHADGKQRKLVITSVTTNSVKGYLLAPEERTLPAVDPAQI